MSRTWRQRASSLAVATTWLGLFGLGVALGTGCGPAEARGPELPFGLTLQGAFPLSELRSFQIVLLSDGSKRDCAQLKQTCLVDQVPEQSWLELGGGKRSLVVDADLAQGNQEVELTGLPVGKDFALLIEAVSHQETFLGSSCNYLRELRDGRNEPLLAQPLEGNPVACDPVP